MEEEAEKIPAMTERYFKALFNHIDPELFEAMPMKFVAYLAHQVMFASVPGMTTASFIVAKEGSDEHLDHFAKGIAVGLHHMAANGWDKVHKAGIMDCPLPAEFAAYLELPKGPVS